MVMNLARRVGPSVLVGMALLGLWQAAVLAWEIPVYLVPSPERVVEALVQDWPILVAAWRNTLHITLLAMAVATVLGVGVSLAFVQSRWLERAFFPYAVLLQVTPIVSVAPLVIIWVKDTTWALVWCATLAAIFPVISNSTLGLRSVDVGLMNYFRLQRASRWQVLWRLRIPSALPYFFGGLRISAGLSLIGAIVAEFVAGAGGAGTGLAYQILQSGYQLNIPRMFAALTLIAVTGVLLFLTTSTLAKWALGGWHPSQWDLDRGQ
jgi:NitT/TauT family transport system permease protein